MVIGSYRPPYFLFNKHLETIYPALFRKVELKGFRRERISTPDNDFLDIDCLQPSLHANAGNPVSQDQIARTSRAMTGSETRSVVILSHGLEGNSQRPYIKGMAKAFFEAGYDVIAWNYRGCGEEVNKQLRFYHSGATDDLDVVVQHAAKNYQSIFLVGFSLGGNITLKYLGESERSIKGAVVFSVPLNLHSSCEKIGSVYADRFLRSLKKKVIDKSKLMKGLDLTGIEKIKTLKTFDDRYTAPLHGFKDAIHYYQSCSSLYFLKGIRVPTLIVNAKNDPFLGVDCYPDIDNPFIEFDYPDHGGHVGFATWGGNGMYWSEQRAVEFIKRVNFPS